MPSAAVVAQRAPAPFAAAALASMSLQAVRERRMRMKTPLHTLKSELGSKSRNKDGFNFGMALWSAHAERWWNDYLEQLGSVNPRNRTRAEDAASKSAAEKLSRDEWVYLLLVDGFFEKEDLDSDIATRAAVLNMRMDKPMYRTHEHDLFETRQFGASFNDLPNPRLVRVSDIPYKLGAVDCWNSAAPGRFRPLRTADARLHPGWAVAGRHAARILFEPRAAEGPEGARRAYDALRSFCSIMIDSIAESQWRIEGGSGVMSGAAPLLRLLNQELSISPNVSDAYVPRFYANVMTGFLLAAVYGVEAVYDYGLIERHRSVTTVDDAETLMYDASFQLNYVKSSGYTATVFLADSDTLAPISMVRTVELDSSAKYAAGRAPSIPEGGESHAWHLLFLPGDESVSRHMFSLEYDSGKGAWVATRPSRASRGWYFCGPSTLSRAQMVECRKGESFVLKPGSRIVVPCVSGMADAIVLPSIVVVFSYRFDLLDGGKWSRDVHAREFLSVGACDIWIDAFGGEPRPLYVPTNATLLSDQWKDFQGSQVIVQRWTGYFDAARTFLAEATELEPDERARVQDELVEGCNLILKMAKKAASILSKDSILANDDFARLHDYSCRLQKWASDARKRG